MCISSLAACGQSGAQPQATEGATRVECALGEGGQYAHDCFVEKVAGEEGPEFVVRHPDGGFRRLRIAPDRRGMIAVDGADEAMNERVGRDGELEVTVGPDRYRFPANLDAGG